MVAAIANILNGRRTINTKDDGFLIFDAAQSLNRAQIGRSESHPLRDGYEWQYLG